MGCWKLESTLWTHKEAMGRLGGLQGAMELCFCTRGAVQEGLAAKSTSSLHSLCPLQAVFLGDSTFDRLCDCYRLLIR